MSFSIILQNNSSPANKIGKELANVKTLSGTLKHETSVIDPTIIIESNSLDEIVSNINYMTISSFGRSYFINKITSIRNNVWEISAHVDVLESFKDEILNNTGIISRQQNKWNLYLDDGVFKCYQNPTVTVKEFPSGFSGQELVLAVAGSAN